LPSRERRSHPELRKAGAVWPDAAKVGDSDWLPIYELDVQVDTCVFHSPIIRTAQRRSLIALALGMIALAVFRRPPHARGFTETSLEGAGKRFGRAEANRQRNLKHRQPWLCDQPLRGHFESPAAQILAQGFSHPGREQAMEVKR